MNLSPICPHSPTEAQCPVCNPERASGSAEARLLAGFVVEAMVVNTDTMKSNWKEIARYPDRETAERVRDMNRRKGMFRVREEQPANDQAQARRTGGVRTP